MGKTQRSAGRTLEIILAVVMCLCIGALGYYGYLMYQEYTEGEKLFHENERVLALAISECEELNKEKAELEAQVKDIENIEERITEIRETYFKNAVKADELVRSGNADFKICYMTFDDGPYQQTTPYFLDVLEKYDVQATFFVLEREGEAYKEILRREKRGANAIGNHTDSHLISLKYADSIYRSEDAFMKAIENNRQYILDACGYYTDVMRFPGGSNQPTHMGLNRKAIIERLVEIGYGYADWNLATGDGGAVRPPEEFLHNVIDVSANYDIALILMHDYSTSTLECLPEMIETLRDQGFIFLALCYDSPTVRKS